MFTFATLIRVRGLHTQLTTNAIEENYFHKLIPVINIIITSTSKVRGSIPC